MADISSILWSQGKSVVYHTADTFAPGQTLNVVDVLPPDFNGAWVIVRAREESCLVTMVTDPGTYESGGSCTV